VNVVGCADEDDLPRGSAGSTVRTGPDVIPCDGVHTTWHLRADDQKTLDDRDVVIAVMARQMIHAVLDGALRSLDAEPAPGARPMAVAAPAQPSVGVAVAAPVQVPRTCG
jgi:hypothetical protein